MHSRKNVLIIRAGTEAEQVARRRAAKARRERPAAILGHTGLPEGLPSNRGSRNSVQIGRKAKPWILGYSNGSPGANYHFRLDNIFLPVSPA